MRELSTQDQQSVEAIKQSWATVFSSNWSSRIKDGISEFVLICFACISFIHRHNVKGRVPPCFIQELSRSLSKSKSSLDVKIKHFIAFFFSLIGLKIVSESFLCKFSCFVQHSASRSLFHSITVSLVFHTVCQLEASIKIWFQILQHFIKLKNTAYPLHWDCVGCLV